jgi:Concanavalin A-like lectin/glucanases superfamily/Divergent InlB B-repeat domain/Fibronectin type III domain
MLIFSDFFFSMMNASVTNRYIPDGCAHCPQAPGMISVAARLGKLTSNLVGTSAVARFARWLLAAAVILGFTARAQAQSTSVMLAWIPSSSPYVAGYDIYWGTSSGVYLNSQDVGANTIATITNLSPNTTYYIAALSYSSTGIQSADTPEITYTTPASTTTPLTTGGSGLGQTTSVSQTATSTSTLTSTSALTNTTTLINSVANDLTNGLIAWYPLAGDVQDYSGNGNNGTAKGSPTFGSGPTGEINTALLLNGSSQYVSLGHPSLYNFGTNDFTFSLWFQTKSTLTAQQLFSCDDASGRQFIFDINDESAGTVTAYFLNQSSVVGYRTPNILAPNTWYHAVLVRQGNVPGALTLYLNDAQVATFAAFQNDFPFTMGTTTSDVEIGRRTYRNYTEPFSGSLSDVRVYNRALPTTDINALFTNGLPVNTLTNGLIAWYPLAGDANDYSTNGNNGTAVGNASYTVGVSGAANSALNLNGVNQYVSLGHPGLYNFGTNNFTFSIWFQTTTIGVPQQLFSCDDASGRQFIFDIADVSSGTVTAYLLNKSSTVGYRTGNILTPYTWYFAVLERSSNTPGALTLYLNGVKVTSFAAFQNDLPFNMGTTSSDVEIGRRTYANYTEPFSGSLSGVRVYNRALSATEINTLYTSDLVAPEGTSILSNTDITLAVAHNTSGTAAVTATNIAPSLDLLISGQGSVASSPDRKSLQPGTKCTLTATAAKNWLFSGWIRNGVTTATTRQYSFLLASKDVVQANFVPNPFLSAAGNYYGLFNPLVHPAEANSGAIAVTLNSQGTFSAKLRLGAQTYPFVGGFSPSGSALASIPRFGLDNLTAQMQLGSNPGTLTGTLTDGTWTAPLLAEASIYSAVNHYPLAGKYSLVLPPAGKSAPLGTNLIIVSDTGAITFHGILPDGTPIISAATVAGQGQWPFYLSFEAGHSSILGWLTFTEDHKIEGELNWLQQP